MISIVIPCYNEGRRLGKSLDSLWEFLKNYPEEVEVIIADDGSTDPTLEVAKSYSDKLPNLRILNLTHLGKGAAVGSGFLESRGNIVLFTDADFSTPITEIDKLVGKIKAGYDIAVGSRALDPSLVKTHQNFLRESMGQTFNLLVRALAVPGISDTQCGFKAFDRATTKILFEKQQIYGFAFDVELLYLAKKHDLKVVEVPILWFNDPHSRVSPIKDSAITMYELLKIRAIHSHEKASLSEKFFYQVYKNRTFLKFAAVGLSVILGLALLYLLLSKLFS